MPREILLHIGMTKTGSTSIQHVLHTNRTQLLAQGIFYPASPGENRHILLASGFTSFPDLLGDIDSSIWLGRQPKVAIEAHIAEIAEELDNLPDRIDRIIISAEQFSMYSRAERDIRRLRDFLLNFADRCRVVVYLRRQDEHFASLYSQFLRLGNVHTPDMNRLSAFHHDYDYADFLGRWAEVFGPDHVCPRLFESTTGKRFDVIADFAEVCGVDIAQLTIPAQARNPSMNQAGQEALRLLGGLLQDGTGNRSVSGPAWQRISEAVTASSPGKGWQPAQDEARAFMSRYAASNEAVRATWFADRVHLFDTDFEGLPVRGEVVPAAMVQAALSDSLLSAVRLGIEREARLVTEKARLAHRLGDAKLRRTALAQAARLKGNDVAHRLRLAECLAEEGDLQGAKVHLDLAAKLAPDAAGVKALRQKLSRLSANA